MGVAERADDDGADNALRGPQGAFRSGDKGEKLPVLELCPDSWHSAPISNQGAVLLQKRMNRSNVLTGRQLQIIGPMCTWMLTLGELMKEKRL